MKKLTPAQKNIKYMLISKYRYFKSKNMLSTDGSFYYDDLRLTEELELSRKTIMRGKRKLKEVGVIEYDCGKYISKATKYWISEKGDKKSPFHGSSKGDNLSEKGDKKFRKACQNVTLNKEIINKKIKTENSGLALVKGQAELVREKEQTSYLPLSTVDPLIALMGKEWMISRLKEDGRSQGEIDEIINRDKNVLILSRSGSRHEKKDK